MLSGEEDVQASALRARGWSISAIARHLGRDRKTVRDYLSGKRVPGGRQRPEPDPFDQVAGCVARRFVRGHGKSPECGQVDVPARGQVKVPTPF